ncbi:MAG: thioredoxin family protein [Actinobacteria bacterium]|nr:thioredoxin family protein [Actinomycetota bacterium]
MATPAANPGVPSAEAVAERPKLVFFFSEQSGRCRRVEGFIAQVLQRRRNHETFDLVRVPVDRRPDLAERFRVDTVPTIVVVEGRRVKRRIVAPRGCRELEAELTPWLR